MVAVDKIERGVADYLDAELMPQLKNNGLEKVIIGTMTSLAIRKSGALISGYKDNKVVKMLGIMDEEGNVDVDVLAEELKRNISKDGVNVDVPILGTLTFRKEDVDKLREYIMS